MNQNLRDQIAQSWLSSIDSTYLESLAKEAVSDISASELESFAQENIKLRSQSINLKSPSGANVPESSPRVSIPTFFRENGYKYAHINPLTPPDSIPPAMLTDPVSVKFQELYAGTITLEADTLSVEKKSWCYHTYERIWAENSTSSTDSLSIFQTMLAAETFERYLGTRFPGAKRFSLEGLEASNVLLTELISKGVQNFGISCIELGLAHRGRLNALANILGKNSLDIFADFEGTYSNANFSGDVKYHQGFSNDFQVGDKLAHVAIAFNPSHLEAVNAVVQGATRARQDQLDLALKPSVLAITTHGDSAFSGQGIVMELLNMSQTRGYNTQGTIHIIMDNQVGFTTSDPRDTRSTARCTDIAKMLGIPVLHINAEDPMVMRIAAKFALQWRAAFKSDCILHVIGYRKYGHNEADEPSATQPLMYKFIRQHESAKDILQKSLCKKGLLTEDGAKQIEQSYRDKLEKGEHIAPWPCIKKAATFDWSPFIGKPLVQKISTGVSIEKLSELGSRLTQSAMEHTLHSRVQKIYADREKMYSAKLPLDWGAAENLAFATLVDQGYTVRLSGQDSRRGTFFQRHCYVVDQITNEVYNTITPNSEAFYAVDSLLSEEAVLGFEYGYATTNPRSLVLWEAQFGDFANGAQVMIDQFIAAGQQKWDQYCGLTLLLPHGYEGQGPEHSSARIERYLQLAAQDNMRICYPSTPAQHFHLLLSQIQDDHRHPLIIFTPKSLLRHPAATSELNELSRGKFRKVLSDEENTHKISRVLLCSGKIYFELKAHQEKNQIKDTVIVRLEQLYPFPQKELEKFWAEHPLVWDFRWVQEEPKNQGAWSHLAPQIQLLLTASQKLRYCGRPESASTATGWHHQHAEEQDSIVQKAFE